jgi:SAM-dependent methyltransferase
MFRENRLETMGFANSPAGWGAHFEQMPRLSRLKALQYRFSPEYRWIKKYLTSPVLDAGCGAGHWVTFLQGQGFDSHGLDYAPNLVATNRIRYPDSKWSVGDIRASGLPDNHFGGIISWGVIEHDEAGPQAALREFHRIMKPRACCIVTVPSDHARQREIGLMDNKANAGHFHQYYFEPEELANEVRKVGFEVVLARDVPRASIALAAPKLYRRFIGTHLFFLARLAALFASKKNCAAMTVCIGRKP